MFFSPKYKEINKNRKVWFTKDTDLEIMGVGISEYVSDNFYNGVPLSAKRNDRALCKALTFEKGIPEGLAEKCSADGNEEEFVLVLGERSRIYFNSDRGAVYGLGLLKSLVEEKKNYEGVYYDRPMCSVRGYRVYLPGKENIKVFKEMVDFLVSFRYNQIILEIGGAMEYKRHPKINEKWIEFCEDMYRYSGRVEDIQRKMYPWEKNSIHCENGDGGVLSQDECRELAEYCRCRGIEIIPECPTLSHSDYIVMAYPEIREMEGDMYPDTYCPNHPDTYKYVFDVLDEVIDVFNPDQIHIGHDEVYSIGFCERCKHTDPAVLFTDDIKKIQDYLKERNIKTSIWAEKLLQAYTAAGTPVGGTGKTGFRNGSQFMIPHLSHCRDMMPDGLLFINWYWEFGKKHDRVYHDRGYEMAFGNFSAAFIDSWKERLEWGCRGGWVSNWGSFEEEYMQRNCQHFNLISAAYLFWTKGYDDPDKPKLLDLTFKAAYAHKWRNERNVITVKHRTLENMKHVYFWCGIFIEDEKYVIGNYEVVYEDGSKALLPVKYGTNIGAKQMPNGALTQEYFQLSGSTLPMGKNGDLIYECKYVDPNPSSKIKSVRYVPIKEEYTVEFEILKK